MLYAARRINATRACSCLSLHETFEIFYNSNKMESEEEAAQKGIKGEPKLGNCEVCAINEAKYTCPKCEVKTCQLACLRIHKKELNCDGIRDKTKYKPLKDMTQRDFWSDYQFLEECTRYTRDRKRDKLKFLTRVGRELPTHLYKLRAACKLRGITVRYLLPHFTRHKENTTRLDTRDQVISWRIEWNFPVEDKNLVLIDEKCNENEKLASMLATHFTDRRLEYYQSRGLDGVCILMKAEGVRACQKRFYELDGGLSLKQNLVGKTIVEFPIIFVISSDLRREFDVVDEDESHEAERRLYERLIGHDGPNLHSGPILPQEKPKEEKAPTNFLFTDESFWESDDEKEITDGNQK